MRYYLIAGEASGDLHGSNLVKHLLLEDPTAELRGWGGEKMSNAGMALEKHYRELAFMGFFEVVKNLPVILNNFKACKSDILFFRPDVLILIDYPGFNLRMAKWAKKKGIRVFYYISPQIWAWHTSRVKIVKDCVERMFVILPFEKDFYGKYQVEVDYIGHPLLDVIDEKEPGPKIELDSKPVIALLPGSRKQEIQRMLRTMLEIVPAFPNLTFVIAGAPSIDIGFYQEFTKKAPGVRIITSRTYDLLQIAHAAIVTSGTATLETTLFGVPQIVCYKGNWFSFYLARMLVNKDLRFISLVNLIAGKMVVPELIQEQFNAGNLKTTLERILADRDKVTNKYSDVRRQLGPAGASRLAAKLMVNRLRNKDY